MAHRIIRSMLFCSIFLALGCGESNPTEPAQDTGTDTVSADASHLEDVHTDAVEDVVEDVGPTCPEPGSTERPAGLGEAFGIMDAKRRKLVFWGGNAGIPVNCQTATDHVDVLWVYDTVCATFEKIETTGGPGPRARGMTVYDPDRDQMVIFGGRYRAAASGPYTVYDEVWALDLETYSWTRIETQGPGPAARSNPAGAYNLVAGEMIVFGGNTSGNGLVFSPLNDVWALDLDNHTWRQIPSMGSKPEARLFHSATVDSEHNRLYIYGGGGANAWTGPFMGDLWVMNLETGTWENLHNGGPGAPMGRIWPTTTWDKVGQQLLLFGGHDDGMLGNTNDTWSFDPASKTWTSITEAEEIYSPANGFCNFPKDFTFPNLDAPERRSGQFAGLDEVRGEWVIFGGKTDCGLIDDVWLFSLAQSGWIKLIGATMGETCNRSDQPQLCVALCQ
jgi:hypothetical protein